MLARCRSMVAGLKLVWREGRGVRGYGQQVALITCTVAVNAATFRHDAHICGRCEV
jgi:hypothetical protein